MTKTTCWGFHDWDKWKIITLDMRRVITRDGVEVSRTPYQERRQQRVCKRCGYTQEKEI